MNRKWWKLIYMLPITFCTLNAGGYVAQFIRNYQTWESAGNFAGNGTAPQIPSPHPLACLDALTAFPYNLFGIFLCLAAFGLLTFLLIRKLQYLMHFLQSHKTGSPIGSLCGIIQVPAPVCYFPVSVKSHTHEKEGQESKSCQT